MRAVMVARISLLLPGSVRGLPRPAPLGHACRKPAARTTCGRSSTPSPTRAPSWPSWNSDRYHSRLHRVEGCDGGRPTSPSPAGAVDSDGPTIGGALHALGRRLRIPVMAGDCPASWWSDRTAALVRPCTPCSTWAPTCRAAIPRHRPKSLGWAQRLCGRRTLAVSSLLAPAESPAWNIEVRSAGLPQGVWRRDPSRGSRMFQRRPR